MKKLIEEIFGKPIPMCFFVDATQFNSYKMKRAQQKEAVRKLFEYDGNALAGLEELLEPVVCMCGDHKRATKCPKCQFAQALAESSARVAMVEAQVHFAENHVMELIKDLKETEAEKDDLIADLEAALTRKRTKVNHALENELRAIINKHEGEGK